MKTSLENAIATQLGHLRDLKALLEQELHLISSREPETLMQLLQDKQSLLDTIESQDSAVETLYQRSSDSGSIPDICEELLQSCKQVLFECKYLTQINAKSVEQGQLRLVHLRNFMMELRAKESMTYDRSGKTSGDSSTKGFRA
ncbi:flagellar export chaperone FlgN [Glaciecola sp. 2405UD65-10]|jgi:flagella synthesis protein FlgN|uniref:flagellar export chaperone FlgN n=1 Tax=Glaciecola sp. 2405UD65-10 TaxID=3397244 RepID=UPI003B5C2404